MTLAQINLCCPNADGTGLLQIVNGLCSGGLPYNCDLSWLQQGNIYWNQIIDAPQIYKLPN
jgi:hypothetical protein